MTCVTIGGCYSSYDNELAYDAAELTYEGCFSSECNTPYNEALPYDSNSISYGGCEVGPQPIPEVAPRYVSGGSGGGDAGRGWVETPYGWVQAIKWSSATARSFDVSFEQRTAKTIKRENLTARAPQFTASIRREVAIAHVDRADVSRYTVRGISKVSGSFARTLTARADASAIKVETLGLDEIYAILGNLHELQ